MSSLKNIGRQLIIKVGGQLVSLCGIIYFTRELHPGELGEYFYFESLIGVVSLIAGLGIVGAIEKYASQGGDADRWLSSGLGAVMFLSVVVSTGFVLINSYWLNLLNAHYILYFILALFGNKLFTIYKHLLRSELRADLAGGLDFLRTLMLFSIGIALATAGFGSESLIIGYLGSFFIIAPIGIYLSNTHLTTPSIDDAIELFHFGKYLAINILGSKIFYLADIILIGLFLTTADVGRYEIAWRLIFAAMMLNGIIANTMFSYISSAHGKGDLENAEFEIHKALRYSLLIPLGTIAGAPFVGDELIQFLFTTEYSTGSYLISILAIGFAFQSLYFLFSRSLVAIGKARMSYYLTVVAVASNLILNFTLIPRYSILGAGVATTSSYFIASTAYYWGLNQHINIRIPMKRTLIHIGSALILSISLFFINLVVGPLEGTSVIIVVVFGGLMYISLLLIPTLTRNDIYTIAVDTALR